MSEQYLVQVGDVIRATSNWHAVNVDSTDRCWISDNGETSVAEFVYQNGDPFEFVAEKVDDIQEGYRVTARCLLSDGRYNEKGSRVYFYQTGSFNCMITSPHVVRKMSLQFVVNTDRYGIKEKTVEPLESIITVEARLAKAQVLATLALAKSIVAAALIRQGTRESKSLTESKDLAEEATKMIADIDYPEGMED